MKRNLLSKGVKLILTGAAVGMLAACGGGSDNNGSGSASSASGTSIGPVTGFGSVYVNGTHFKTNADGVKGDDGITLEGQLEKGMILKVSGTWGEDGEGKAQQLLYDDTVRGPLSTFNWNTQAKTGTLIVAGQTILVDQRTVFKGASPLELSTNATDYWVRVSAWRQADGTFKATFVGSKKTADFGARHEVEIEGVIKNLDVAKQSFTINGLLVDYTNAEFDDIPGDTLANDMVVEVEGKLATVNGTLTLIAEEVEGEDDLAGYGDDIEISGAISGEYDVVNRQFFLNGFIVQVTDKTEFEDGLAENRLKEGLQIEVEGEYRDGVIMAEEIEPRDGEAELSGKIEEGVMSDDYGDYLVVGGVKVRIDSNTLIEDDNRKYSGASRENWRADDLASLTVGKYVEVEGRQSDIEGGALIAMSIEIDTPDDDEADLFELEGIVNAVSSTSITIMGVELFYTPGSLPSGVIAGKEIEVTYTMNTGGSYDIIEFDD